MCAPAAARCGTSPRSTAPRCAARPPAPKGDAAATEALLGGVLHNVKIMDKGARESIVSFEKGVGDAAITYENEVLVGRQAGRDYDYVVPRATILIENPVAVVDTYADKHGNRDLADAFVAFLTSPAAQRAFTEYRPATGGRGRGGAEQGPVPRRAGPVHDPRPGGWPAATQTLFAPGGVYDRVMAAPKPQDMKTPMSRPAEITDIQRGRVALRSGVMIYVGALVVLPLAALVQHGLADGLLGPVAGGVHAGRRGGDLADAVDGGPDGGDQRHHGHPDRLGAGAL